jgi:hypothetical protein
VIVTVKKRAIQLSQMLDMEDPQKILDEVREIVLMMFPEFAFGTVESVYNDIVRLFRGEYPGYRKCTTEYHDLNHTTDVFLVMARLMHGASLGGEKLTKEYIDLGLICALMHDTGYIQTVDDKVGTGAKYALIDTKRSIAFMQKYMAHKESSREDFRNYSDILKCTSLDTKIKKTRFESREIELLGKMLGTADLLGQMADRTYLEKLLFLFYEFREGGILGYDNELDLLRKTVGFYAKARKRLSGELDGVNKFMRSHFKARWNIDRDLYMEALENNMNYLKFIMENHEKDYRNYLRRGSLVEKLKERLRKRPHP